MSKNKFSFSLLKTSGSARLGKINTTRGEIETPTFMTVGTQGTIKSVFIEDAISAGAQIILSNTYHLMIRPGVSRIKRVGMLHEVEIARNTSDVQISFIREALKKQRVWIANSIQH